MTGFSEIDRAIGGFEPGDLITLAADTGKGKTAFALGVAAHVAAQGGAVLIVSAEMKPRELGKRFLQARSGVYGSRVRFAKSLRTADWTALENAAGDMENWKVHIQAGSASVAEIAAKARQLSAEWGKPLDLIVVDYLQLMRATEGESRAQQVGGIAWGLKQAAMDLNTPVLLLSQLNRAGVQTQQPPHMHSLKESGDVENHSNSVLLLYCPPEAQADAGGVIEVWAKVAKARDGVATPWQGAGSIHLAWRPAITRFDPEQIPVPAATEGQPA